jgi:hypothetical protein
LLPRRAALSPELESSPADIDQRARIAERKLEILEESAAAAKAATPVVAAGERGFNWSSADKAYRGQGARLHPRRWPASTWTTRSSRTATPS